MKLELPKKYLEVLEEGKIYERRCFEGKRWGGDPLLIIVDSALDSVGLNYFKIVVPRVKLFKKLFIDTKRVVTLKDAAKLSPDDSALSPILNYRRVWNVVIKLSKIFSEIAASQNITEFEALKRWAVETDYKKWRVDPVGRVRGVGLVTFQYLRMQVGVDTCMPDKIIKKFAKIDFGLDIDDDFRFIEAFKKLSERLGISQILLSWLIWLAESDNK